MIVGGWEFVWGAYGLTFAAFLIYGINVIVRLRNERARATENGKTP
ncbi:MAG TPA: hypothetical protein VF608_07630 [Thermoanaerobaculia bacterium]